MYDCKMGFAAFGEDLGDVGGDVQFFLGLLLLIVRGLVPEVADLVHQDMPAVGEVEKEWLGPGRFLLVPALAADPAADLFHREELFAGLQEFQDLMFVCAHWPSEYIGEKTPKMKQAAELLQPALRL